MTLKVVEAHFCHPGNGTPGLYVQLHGRDEDINSEESTNKAREIAKKFGFDPDGRGDVGWPVRYGPGTLTKAFHFTMVAGKFCGSTPEGKAAIERATTGPDCVYQYPQQDPRRKGKVAS